MYQKLIMIHCKTEVITMEKWNAYTKDGMLTDKILVRDEPIPDGLYHLSCEVLVRHKDGSYLCMKRALSKRDYPGYYEATAGGSAFLGEDKYDCIKRELKEETGIECNDFEEIGCYIYDDNHSIFHIFVCTVDCDKNSIVLQEGETEDYIWLDEQEFIKFVNSDKMIDRQKVRYYDYFVRMNYII